MSEPVSNIEIEDVLSSIRRLVSEETRIEPRSDPQKKPPQNTRLVLTPALRVAPDPQEEQDSDWSEATDTLAEPVPDVDVAPMPLHSVDDFSGSDVDVEPDTDTGPDVTDETAPHVQSHAEPDAGSWADSDLEPDSTSGLDDSDSAPSIDLDAPWHDPDTTLFQAAELVMAENAQDDNTTQDEAPEDSPEASAQPVWDAPEEDYLPEIDYPPEQDHLPEEDFPEEDLSGEDLTDEYRDDKDQGEQDRVEDDQDEDDQDEDDQDEDDQDEDDQDEDERGQDDRGQDEWVAEPLVLDSALDSSSSESWVEDEPTVSDLQDQTTDSAGETPQDTSEQAEASQDRAATLSAKIAALEEKIGQTQDQWEPDGEVGDDYAGTQVETIEWQDHNDDDSDVAAPYAQPRAEPVSEPSVPVDKDDETPDFLGSDDTILDEESLRELVADIVRQELQGALGERITRNVRKLVRREIHRALTAQELD